MNQLFLQQHSAQMISLQDVDNFNNITNPYNITITMERTVLSPQGTFMLRYDPYNIRLYDLIEKAQIPISINTTILKAVFSLEEESIIFSNLIGVSSYEITSHQISTIISQSSANYITDFQINEDYTILYYLNKSALASVNLQTLKPLSSGSNTKNCNPVKMKYDSNTQTIITSTLANGQSVCFLCKWNITNNNFVFRQSTNISFCVVNDIYIMNNQIAITKKRFNINLMNTIILDFETLNEITRTTQSRSNGNPGFIVPYHNYYFQYFSLSNFIYVYKDNFVDPPFTIPSQFIVSLQFDPSKQLFYVISKHPTGNINIIRTRAPKFNCSIPNNTVYNASNPFDTNCQCTSGMIFNKSSFQCQASTCGGDKNPCICPAGNTFNTFNLKCELKCSNISGAYFTQPFGNPPKCLCQSPRVWNTSTKDCSSINCALLNHSSSTNIARRCDCSSGFAWNSEYQFCIEKESSLPVINNPNSTNMNMTSLSDNSGGSPAGLIIGLMILLLLLIGAAIYYYYRRCKNNQESQSNQHQPEVNPTERQVYQQQKANPCPNIQSNEELKPQAPNHYSANSSPQKSQKDQAIQENLDNFSIDQDQQPDKQQYFSEIQSNIENPLH